MTTTLPGSRCGGRGAAPRAAGREGGFTLIELMVALFVGAIVIGSIYVLFANSQKIFHQESRISQAQLAIRAGMELLKNDVRRAGYLSSPNTDTDPLVCRNEGVTDMRLHPVIHLDGRVGQVYSMDGSLAAIPYSSQNAYISPDALVLVGNFTNAQTYIAEQIDTVAGSVKLQTLDLQPPPPIDPAADGWTAPASIGDNEFANMFPSTSFLRVVNRHGRMSFARIQGTTSAAERTINVAANALRRVSQEIQCGVEGYGEGSEVNVVNAILYRVELDTSADTADPGDPSTPYKKMDLVRYMLDQDMNVIPATREVVIEHVVDFQVWYRQDDPEGASGPQPNVDMDWQPSLPLDNVIVLGIPGGTSPAPLDGSENAFPERLRSAIIKISVRTDVEDPDFPFIARTSAGELHRFELNPNALGAAHVRTLVTEVKLPNIAFRNLR